ncbi:hypothetical protein RYX36_014665 [Vicia faba]
MVVEKSGSNNHHQTFDLSIDQQIDSKFFDDDGRVKRTGTSWTASAHVITAVIGSGVLSLAWAIAQLGWIAGPIVMFLFAWVTYYTSVLLCECYRNGDPVNGKRNYTYMEVVHSNLDSDFVNKNIKIPIPGLNRYKLNLFRLVWRTVFVIVATLVSMLLPFFNDIVGLLGAIGFWPLTVYFPVEMYIVQKKIPKWSSKWICLQLLSGACFIITIAATIGSIAGITLDLKNKKFAGTITGINDVTKAQKTWGSLQALGDIAFAYSFSMILIEIQDTIKAPPPSESKTMKKATLISVIVTTFFYMLCGCFGYAAFGNSSPGNLLTGFGFYNPFWLLDIANAAIVIHLIGAYQVYCQPLFAFVENYTAKRFPDSDFVNKNIKIPIPGLDRYKLNLFRLIWRTVYVILTTLISMLLPFFNDIVGLLGAIGFWPLTVYFPVEMYIIQKKIPKWSTKWICLQLLSGACLIITIAATIGSIAGLILDLKVFKPFKTIY